MDPSIADHKLEHLVQMLDDLTPGLPESENKERLLEALTALKNALQIGEGIDEVNSLAEIVAGMLRADPLIQLGHLVVEVGRSLTGEGPDALSNSSVRDEKTPYVLVVARQRVD